MTRVTRFSLAEEVGFEPTVPVDTAVFETARFGRSRTPPGSSLLCRCEVTFFESRDGRTATTVGMRSHLGPTLVKMERDDQLPMDDERFMNMALAKAREAQANTMTCRWGVSWCSVVKFIGIGENRREIDGDPTAHAEIVALCDAVSNRPGWRLDGATVYVTLEPCVMCAGALLNARVDVW